MRWILGVFLLVVETIVVLFAIAVSCEATEPVAALQLRGVVVDVYDGDTVTVEFKLLARVRLLDCWAPEIKTTDANEKRRGLNARDFLKGMADKKPVVVVVPLDEANRLDDLFTFGRLLGHIYLRGEDESLSEKMRTAGHATASKQ